MKHEVLLGQWHMLVLPGQEGILLYERVKQNGCFV